jgi:hypothetical protein
LRSSTGFAVSRSLWRSAPRMIARRSLTGCGLRGRSGLVCGGQHEGEWTPQAGSQRP